jgi:RNase adapter protein RapZ
MKVVVLSGISGSGKSTALKALEDIGFFCVDNFPLMLLNKFLEVCELTGEKVARCAFVVDIRMKEFFDQGRDVLKSVKERYGAEFIFLECADDVILRRYKETRRLHPLLDTHTIREALAEERKLVTWIRDIADRVIDTSLMNTHELRAFILKTFSDTEQRMKINVMSFGYAYGIPLETDMAFDVRFLPNPFFVPELKEKTGLAPEVGRYIETNEVYASYFRLLTDFLAYLIPLFEKEGKSYLTISIGCTGGKHRSVFVAGQAAKHLAGTGYSVNVVHRDIER